MTGIVSIYLAIINSISNATFKITQKHRRYLINGTVFVMLCIGTINYCNKTIKGLVHFSDWALVVSVAALLVFVIASIDKKIDRSCVIINKPFWIGWILCFALMFIMSFIHPVRKSYFAWSIEGLFLFPLIFLIWSSPDRRRQLFDIVAVNTLRMAYIFIFASFLMVPFFTTEGIDPSLGYIGMAANQNNNGMIVLSFYAASLYLLLTDRKSTKLKFAFPMGVCIAIAIISKCRTAELGIIMQTLLGIAYLYATRDKTQKQRVDYVRIVAVIIMTIAVAIASGFALKYFNSLDLEVHAEDGSFAMITSSEDIFIELNYSLPDTIYNNRPFGGTASRMVLLLKDLMRQSGLLTTLSIYYMLPE